MHAPANKLLILICAALSASAAASAADARPVNVKTVSYKDIAYFPEHNTAAEVIARHDSKVSGEIAAVVLDVKHDTGDRVKQGDAVIVLDCRTYELQMRQAMAVRDSVSAQYDNAKKLFASAQKLQKQNNISQELYNQRNADASRLKAELLNARAGVESAAIAVDKCSIKAPYDGYISERFISKGEHVQPGTPVFQMITSEQGRVEAHINSFEYESFLQGKDFRFVFNGVAYELAIDAVLPVLDKTFRTHTARLSFTEKAAPTGSHGSLTWRDAERAIPSSLVVIRNGQAGVLVANNESARFIPVEGYIEGHPATIELEADTQIITTGRHGLNDGDSIQIVSAAD